MRDEISTEPLGSELCCEETASAAEAGAPVVATPAPLPDESMSLHDLMTSGPDPHARKAKLKPKAKAKPKAEAKPKAASKAPKAKAKPKSESSKLAKDKTASAVESDPGTSPSSMVVEPPSTHALSDPYEDDEGDDFPGMEKLFEDYVPGEYSGEAVEDPRRPSLETPASGKSEEVPKPDDESRRPPDPKDADKRCQGQAELRKEAKSVHHLLTHMPKNPFCPTCQRANMYKPPSYKTDGIRSIKSETFGEHLICDHIIVYRDNEASIEGCRLVLMIKDVGTSCMPIHPDGSPRTSAITR